MNDMLIMLFIGLLLQLAANFFCYVFRCMFSVQSYSRLLNENSTFAFRAVVADVFGWKSVCFWKEKKLFVVDIHIYNIILTGGCNLLLFFWISFKIILEKFRCFWKKLYSRNLFRFFNAILNNEYFGIWHYWFGGYTFFWLSA